MLKAVIMSLKDFEMDDKFRKGASMFLDQIPFNKMLGLELIKLDADVVQFKLPMKKELVGNFLQGILHGGAISTALDVTGGAMALIGAYAKLDHLPESEKAVRLAKLGTIDMRVDFLRPGKGTEFTSSAYLLRSGNKVAVTRMEFHNELGDLIAVGTGTYFCG